MKRIFIIIFFICLSAGCLWAAGTAPLDIIGKEALDTNVKEDVLSIPGGMEGLISLDLRNIDIIDALKFLAIKADINIITTKQVSGRVSFMVKKVPVKDIFDLMLRSNGLAYAKQGQIYNVMSGAEYKAIFGENFSDIRQVKTFRLKYAIPDQAFVLLDTLKSDIGRVLVEPDSGTALIMDTPEKIREIENALATMEQENLVQVFTLKYANAKDVEEQLRLHLDAKKVGTVNADERSNQLIVQALPGRMPGIQRLIESLDEKTKEVIIDTKIVKIRLKDTRESGVEWEGIFDMARQLGLVYLGSTPYSTRAAASALTDLIPNPTRYDVFSNDSGRGYGTDRQIGSIPFSPNVGGMRVPGEELHMGWVSKSLDFDIFLKLLQTVGDTQIISSPKLAVINNHEARIHVGQRQAYITSTTTQGQSTTTISEEVTFIDVGIQLSLTPTINDDGYVTLKIKPEISSVIGSLTTPSGNLIPIIDTSMAETTVMVKDGSTIIIGGMSKDEKTDDTDQIPGLGNIPVLGFLFKKSKKSTERTELLVMITPHIIDGDILVTGDERDFASYSGKNFKTYTPLSKLNDVAEPDLEVPTSRIKSYRDYTSYDEKPKYKPTIKLKE